MYDHTFLNLQVTRSDIRPHTKWAVSLVIAYGHFSLPRGFVWVWRWWRWQRWWWWRLMCNVTEANISLMLSRLPKLNSNAIQNGLGNLAVWAAIQKCNLNLILTGSFFSTISTWKLYTSLIFSTHQFSSWMFSNHYNSSWHWVTLLR